MNGLDHYKAAEQALEDANRTVRDLGSPERMEHTLRAVAHGLLALAAVTATPGEVRGAPWRRAFGGD
jgi:hypothetical protein